jgi:hypothetical protein
MGTVTIAKPVKVAAGKKFDYYRQDNVYFCVPAGMKHACLEECGFPKLSEIVSWNNDQIIVQYL